MKSRKSFIVHIGRIIQRIPLGVFLPFEKMIVGERVNSIEQKDFDMIVLMAAPRSGSTLTYQCFMAATNVFGLSNVANLLFRIPLIGLLIQNSLCRDSTSKFNSNEGFIGGLCGASEGMMFWGKWTSSSMDDRRYTLDYGAHAHFKNVAMHLTKKTGRPLMSGYLGHTLNAGTLQNNFTNVRYVVLFRDPINTALSLLKVRRKSEAEWISIFPKECESVLERSIFEQVMAQVYWANRRLLKCARAKNSIVMHFEELCSDPNGTVSRVVGELRSNGSRISFNDTLPDNFVSRDIDNMSPDYLKLKDCLYHLENKFGNLDIY